MNHQWKLASLQEVVRYNRLLLVALVIISFLGLLLTFALLGKEEKWVIIPANDTNTRLEISNTKLYPSYLSNWASYVAREVLTTSPEEIEKQHAQIRIISASSKELDNFFAKQLEFVKGSNVSSVFFVKGAKLVDGGVMVNGTLHYWFAGSDQKISLEKRYLISYQESGKGLVLLSNIEEYKSKEGEEK